MGNASINPMNNIWCITGKHLELLVGPPQEFNLLCVLLFLHLPLFIFPLLNGLTFSYLFVHLLLQVLYLIFQIRNLGM